MNKSFVKKSTLSLPMPLTLLREAPNRDYQTRREKETFNDENWVYKKRIYIRIVEVTYLGEWEGEMKFEIIVSRSFCCKS